MVGVFEQLGQDHPLALRYRRALAQRALLDRLNLVAEPTYTIKALDESTWPAFAALVERNNGIFGGCWCMGFHPEGVDKDTTAAQNRERKLDRVRAGTAHAALVFDGDDCVGWCQFGAPDEVPRIKNRAAYEKGRTTSPDWRIACCFVGKGHRRQGVAAAALAGALDLIAGLGGGTVEGYPEDAGSVPAGFLFNGALSTYEKLGLRPRPQDRQAPLGRDEGRRADLSRAPWCQGVNSFQCPSETTSTAPSITSYGGLIVDRVSRHRQLGGPFLCVGHGIVRHVLVIHVRKYREINQSQRSVATGGRLPADGLLPDVGRHHHAPAAHPPRPRAATARGASPDAASSGQMLQHSQRLPTQFAHGAPGAPVR